MSQEIEAWRARLDGTGPLARTWVGRLRRDLEAEAVAASTIMEGVPVTVEEVRRILAGERPPEVTEENRALVEGYREAMSFVLRRADDPSFHWDRELLVSLHDRVLGGSFALGAGRLRTDQRYVVDSRSGEQIFLPPPGEEVPPLVDEACRFMEGFVGHPALAAAWIHIAVAAIHPFSDGNGRVARILASLAMYRGGFRRPQFTSLEEWWGRHRTDYYSSFRCLGTRFDRHTDVTPFCRAHVQAQLSQVRALELREHVERQIWTALENFLGEKDLPLRLANALWDAFFGRNVTAGYYRSVADVSPATATHDLATATAAGLLEAQGMRRGRRYLAGPTLFRALGASLLGLDLPSSPEEARAFVVAKLTERARS
ncbi:MAG: Fic family protein [Myxococcota bacterium]